MDIYKILLYPKALHEIDDIYDYIANLKYSHENARNQTDRIKSAIKKLSTLPYAHQDRLEGTYANKDHKQLLVDNYMIIYKIDEENKIIKVVTVQYIRRNV